MTNRNTHSEQQEGPTYAGPVSLAIAFHIIIVVVFLTSIFFPSPPLQVPGANTHIISATAVNEQAVAQQMAKIKEEQRQQELAKEEALREQQQAEAAKQQAEQEQQQQLQEQQQRLAQQKAQQELQKQQAIAAQQALLKQQALLQQQALQAAKQAKLQAQQAAKAAKQAAAAKAAKLQAAQQAAKAIKQQQQQTQVAKQTTTKPKSAVNHQQDADDLMQQQLDADQQQLNSQRNSYNQSIIDKYKALIINAIQQQWIIPSQADKNLSCDLLIDVAPGGAVISVQLIQSSGVAALDQSAISAVYKASPLPVPTDQDLFNNFRQLNLTVKPENVVNG